MNSLFFWPKVFTLPTLNEIFIFISLSLHYPSNSIQISNLPKTLSLSLSPLNTRQKQPKSSLLTHSLVLYLFTMPSPQKKNLIFFSSFSQKTLIADVNRGLDLFFPISLFFLTHNAVQTTIDTYAPSITTTLQSTIC